MRAWFSKAVSMFMSKICFLRALIASFNWTTRPLELLPFFDASLASRRLFTSSTFSCSAYNRALRSPIAEVVLSAWVSLMASS